MHHSPVQSYQQCSLPSPTFHTYWKTFSLWRWALICTWTVIQPSLSCLCRVRWREGREEVRIMSRKTELYQSKQTAAWVAVLSVCVGGETGGNNVLFTWVWEFSRQGWARLDSRLGWGWGPEHRWGVWTVKVAAGESDVLTEALG